MSCPISMGRRARFWCCERTHFLYLEIHSFSARKDPSMDGSSTEICFHPHESQCISKSLRTSEATTKIKALYGCTHVHRLSLLFNEAHINWCLLHSVHSRFSISSKDKQEQSEKQFETIINKTWILSGVHFNLISYAIHSVSAERISKHTSEAAPKSGTNLAGHAANKSYNNVAKFRKATTTIEDIRVPHHLSAALTVVPTCQQSTYKLLPLVKCSFPIPISEGQEESAKQYITINKTCTVITFSIPPRYYCLFNSFCFEFEA